MKTITTFELYDGRYLTDPDSAICFEVCESLEEAMQEKDNYGTDTVVVKAISEEIAPRKYMTLISEIVN